VSRLRVAILGGGIAGVTAAWQLAQQERAHGGIDATLFEATERLGGTVETVVRDEFVVECGPDGWVTEKPWARELIRELGLHTKLIASNDAERVTYVLSGGKLVAIPDGMRMMVPTDLAALEGSPLFSAVAKQAYADEPLCAGELMAQAPKQDESISAFVERHFGDEVLRKVAAPLLSGVFGGDVAKLSVRAVMPAFVKMEREHGSLILALQESVKARDLCEEKPAIFTSLQSGTGSLIDRLKAELPPAWIRLQTPVTALSQEDSQWFVEAGGERQPFDAVMVAVPAHVAKALLAPLSSRMAELLTMEASSAVIAAFAFTESFALPRGFGFLAPAGEDSGLLAATFVDQKYPGRVPESGGRVLRAFFGGSTALQLAGKTDAEIAELARKELEAILGPLPKPAFSIVRRWPRSLPQYEVGHLRRVAELESLVRDQPNLWLLGNAYRGVGLPDLIRDARAAARELLERTAPDSK
jgi:oxygen-dependent protoporphyrinogen oxidase